VGANKTGPSLGFGALVDIEKKGDSFMDEENDPITFPAKTYG